MNRIAEAECETCHLIRPKNEMRPVRVRRKSGSSFGFSGSRYTGNSGYQGNRTGQSYRTSYSHQEVWVCEGCKKPRSDWTPAHYAALGVAALIVFVLFSGGNSTKDSVQERSAVENVGPDSNLDATALSAQVDEPADDENALAIANEGTFNAAESPEQSNTAAFDFATAAVTDAEMKALQTGKPIRWSSGGYSGFAVPSEAVANGRGAQCRNVYVTASINGDEQRSPVQQMCTSNTAVSQSAE